MTNIEKRIFISGKIETFYYSKVSNECKDKFNKAQYKDLFQYKNVYNPLTMAYDMEFYFGDDFKRLKSNIEYVNKKELEKCDAVYMLKDWQDSEGATKEHELAKKLNKEIIYQ